MNGSRHVSLFANQSNKEKKYEYRRRDPELDTLELVKLVFEELHPFCK
jgi:hypothetical protein